MCILYTRVCVCASASSGVRPLLAVSSQLSLFWGVSGGAGQGCNYVSDSSLVLVQLGNLEALAAEALDLRSTCLRLKCMWFRLEPRAPSMIKDNPWIPIRLDQPDQHIKVQEFNIHLL